MSRFHRFEHTLGRIALSLLAVGLSLWLVETGFRHWKGGQTDFFLNQVNDVDYFPRPYVMSVARPLVGDRNILGYRGPLPTSPKPNGEYRIFIVGGSSVYRGNPPFSSLLETILHDRGHAQARVFNIGAVSSVSRQDLARVLIDLAGFEPDLIVFYGGGNDLIPIRDSRINYPHRFMLYESNPLMALDVRKYKLKLALALGSQFMRSMFPEWLYKQFVDPELDQQLRDASALPNETRVEAYVQNLRLANILSRHLGAKFLAVFQPLLATKKTRIGAENGLVDGFNFRRTNTIYQLLQTELKPYSNELAFVDFTHIFDGIGKPIYVDYIHTIEECHAIIAERLSRIIEPYFKITPARQRPRYWPEPHFLPQPN